ncbi:uncharacterized protein LOC142643166 [Castanea sativa]|uniref:uncharacterized protein LOC142643166 n=1 Tax=Castanea sativa TaxID=21020 RepID=UPI003F650558
MTDQPIRKSMNKPEAAGRMVQWVIELNQFDIEYHPRTAIKAQALADYIAEFTLPEDDDGSDKLERWTIQTDGYFWLTMQTDATELVRRCDKCQRFGNVQRLPAEKMMTITSPWPFAQWGIDIVGPLAQGKGQDNGRQFNSQGFRDVCSGLGIRNQFSSPGHPQANRQTEVTNQTLLRIIKARLDEAKVEVGVASTRREVFREEDNNDLLRINLDCLDEVRDKASSKTMKYQRKMTEYYNKRIKLRRLEIGDLVLRKVTNATKNSAHGKLGPTWEDLTESSTTPCKAATTWKP